MTRTQWIIIVALGAAVAVVFALLAWIALAPEPAPPLISAAPQILTTPIRESQPPTPSASVAPTRLQAGGTVAATVGSQPAATAVPTSTLTFDSLCKDDPSVTSAQRDELRQSSIGARITNWQGWVFDMKADGQMYSVQIGMLGPRSNEIEIKGVAQPTAAGLYARRRVRFSGTLKSIASNCSKIIIENATILPAESIESPLTFSTLCDTLDLSKDLKSRDDYSKSSIGKRLANWQGWVMDSSTDSNYSSIMIGMHKPDQTGLPDIYLIGVPKDIAAKLKGQQKVTFSGTISSYVLPQCTAIDIEYMAIK